MSIKLAVLTETIKMAVRAIPNLWRTLTGRQQPPDFLLFEMETKLQALSEPARVALWHLADRGMRPEPLGQILKDARFSVGVDSVIQELSRVGLVTGDFSGTQSIPSDLISVVKRVLRK